MFFLQKCLLQYTRGTVPMTFHIVKYFHNITGDWVTENYKIRHKQLKCQYFTLIITVMSYNLPIESNLSSQCTYGNTGV